MFITTIHSIDSLEKLKRAKADAVIIGVEHYSIRSCITVKKRIYSFGRRSVKAWPKIIYQLFKIMYG